MAQSALEVWTSPRRTPWGQLAMFIAQSCRQTWPTCRIARADDVWSCVVVLSWLYATPEITSHTRKALGDFVGLTTALWNIAIHEEKWNVKP